MKNEDPKKLYEQAFTLLEQRKLTEAAEQATNKALELSEDDYLA